MLRGQHGRKRARKSARGAWDGCPCTMQGRLACTLTGVVLK